MFTGIVQNLGVLKAKKIGKDGATFEIFSSLKSTYFKKGASILVDGVCLTVEAYDKKKCIFRVFLVPETLKRSRFFDVKVGDKFNLEPPITLNTALSGHIVSGHVDATGEIISTNPFRILVPKKYLCFMPEKGSVSINGVSLTIAKTLKNGIEIALIPETKKSTNLGFLKKGAIVNLEIDLIARYLHALLPKK
ncbi:MAG: riboflavin synthase [Candidatus Gracilibacteria bacterium]